MTSAVTIDPARRQRPEVIRAVGVRHPGRWVAAVVVAVLLAMVVHTVFANQRFGWSEQGQYVFSPQILNGVRTTLMLTVVSMLVGVVLGILLAVMRLSPNPLVSGAAWVYIWVFRGTPVLVQLIIWGSLGALYPRLSLGIPFGPELVSSSTNTLVPGLVAALLGLGLNEGAYMAEIVRAGLLSVDEGQTEAASALGMSRSTTLRRIVLPQAMRVIIPPMTSQYLNLTKNSSLAVAIGYQDVTSIASTTLNQTGQAVEGIAAIMAVYLTISLSISLYMNHYNARKALVER